MRKKKSSSPKRNPDPSNSSKPVFTSPFKDLKKLLAARPKTRTPSPPIALALPVATAQPPAANDDELLRQALEGVRPLARGKKPRMPADPPVGRRVSSEDAEVLAALSDLVSKKSEFDLTETEEYVEGARVGLDPRLVVRLRRGEFAIQAHRDLHGMVQADAKEALTSFILDSVRQGRRAVLVVHGRGLRSPGGHPVLKHATAQWLSTGTLSGYVLAFTTARPADGGAGAVYVLLQRKRRRAPFDVLNGTKRLD